MQCSFLKYHIALLADHYSANRAWNKTFLHTSELRTRWKCFPDIRIEKKSQAISTFNRKRTIILKVAHVSPGLLWVRVFSQCICSIAFELTLTKKPLLTYITNCLDISHCPHGHIAWGNIASAIPLCFDVQYSLQPSSAPVLFYHFLFIYPIFMQFLVVPVMPESTFSCHCKCFVSHCQTTSFIPFEE